MRNYRIVTGLLCYFLIMPAFGSQVIQTREMGGIDFELSAEASDYKLYFKDVEHNNSVLQFTIGIQPLGSPAAPPKMSLKWQTPSHDIAGIWTPQYNNDLVIPADWSSKGLESMLTQNAPVYLLFGHDDVNRYSVSLGDAVNPVKMSARVREEDSLIYHEIEFFNEQHQTITSYETRVRIDTRSVPFYSSLKDVSRWWAKMEQYKPTTVPLKATEPMYSTWYSYHQNIEHEALVEEAKLAASMGYEAIIVDDGWQTTDSNRGYAYTGDWKPERLTNMKVFVSDIHELGMDAILWYSIPFVGEKSDASAAFEGKYLKHIPSLGTYVLDPRYPEVREFLIEHYVHAVKEWGWDGLKLDFIDQFRTQDDTVLKAVDGRDYASIYKAVDTLMSDLIKRLASVNPDVMVEFRQRYIGPAMRKYGNMFRATDIPNGAVTNRRRIVDLRLLSGNTAVHSDMLMWHYQEPVEIAALQILNVLHSVPQLSMRLAELPESHIKMVRHYTQYWKDNKDILLSDDFRPKGIFSNYPLIQSNNESKSIVVVYDDLYLHADNPDIRSMDIINAKKSERLVIRLGPQWRDLHYRITDVTGELVKSGEVTEAGNYLEMQVPVSGMLLLERD